MATTEMDVLTKHYSKLCNTLTDIDNLLPHFVEEKIVSFNDHSEINIVVISTKKVQRLMAYTSNPVRAGNTEVFYIMLRIMEEHGHHATQQLADQIRRSLTVTNEDKSSHHCSKS